MGVSEQKSCKEETHGIGFTERKSMAGLRPRGHKLEPPAFGRQECEPLSAAVWGCTAGRLLPDRHTEGSHKFR